MVIMDMRFYTLTELLDPTLVGMKGANLGTRKIHCTQPILKNYQKYFLTFYHLLQKALTQVRYVIVEIGRRLLSNSPEEVFFLQSEEVRKRVMWFQRRQLLWKLVHFFSWRHFGPRNANPCSLWSKGGDFSFG